MQELHYPQFNTTDLAKLSIFEYSALKCEQGSWTEVNSIMTEAKEYLTNLSKRLQAVKDDEKLLACEPNDLDEIKKLRTDGVRKIWSDIPANDLLKEKMMGALLGRICGCLLGVPVEGFPIETMKGWADYLGEPFPYTDYLTRVENPYMTNCYGFKRALYERETMKTAPVDDDITYTQIALLVMEKYGIDFTTADMGEIWKAHLPVACTAEEVALNNLKKGILAQEVGEIDNPYTQWIGAAIRSDGFGWACAGYPEKAAELAYRDGYLSHRRNGIYGEMFLAASQSAAFAVSDPIEAVKIGMTEIPKDCLLYQDLQWALDNLISVTDYISARKLVDERFKGMNNVHTNNNLCLIVFGLKLADGDFLRGISQTVAMGLDNDCTGASVGSILGAVLGEKAIPTYLYERFNNIMESYLTDVPPFKIDETAERFIALLKKVYAK